MLTSESAGIAMPITTGDSLYMKFWPIAPLAITRRAAVSLRSSPSNLSLQSRWTHFGYHMANLQPTIIDATTRRWGN